MFFPIILPALISRFGIMVTTRIYAVALAVCMLPALPFLKARLPETRVHGPAPRSGPRPWMRDRAFWFFITINTLQGFAHFVPLTWLPSASLFSCPTLLLTRKLSLCDRTRPDDWPGLAGADPRECRVDLRRVRNGLAQ